MDFLRYTKIRHLPDVVDRVQSTLECPEASRRALYQKPVTFAGKVKLHGTNAGVRWDGMRLYPQSRNRDLTPESDNGGFAAFVAQWEEDIKMLFRWMLTRDGLPEDLPAVLYGEWIGPGIQNGMAVNQLPHRQWVLFGMRRQETDDFPYVEGDLPNSTVLELDEVPIYAVDAGPSVPLTIDFTNPEDVAAKREAANGIALAVEESCPWGAKFGIQGMGEGVVWTPTGKHAGDPDLFWKSKGPKHREVKRARRNLSRVEPEVVASVDAFIADVVTEARLHKGLDYLREMGLPISTSSTGEFLKWVGQDVKAECEGELKARDLRWVQVRHAVSFRAKEFFSDQLSRGRDV